MLDAIGQWQSHLPEMLQDNLDWAVHLPRRQRRDLQHRAKELDAQPGPRSEGGRLRVVILASGSDFSGDQRVHYELAYHLGKAGHLVWLVSYLPVPNWLPPDYREFVQWVAVTPDRPLHLAIPPADIILATTLEQVPALYRAGCPFVYLEQGNQLLFESETTRWHDAMCDPIYYMLPSQVLVVSEHLRNQIKILGRDPQVIPVAVDPAPSYQPETLGQRPEVKTFEQVLRSAAATVKRDPLRKGRPRVSLCMIVKNEAERIQSCLASAWGVVDEICVVDTGSTDETIKLAERAGARVEVHPWEDDFAASRNYSLAMASGDWVLQLDGDEELTPALRDELDKLVRRPDIGGFLIALDSKTPTGLARNYALRLFRRLPDVKYIGRVHESVGPSLSAYNPTWPVVHHPIMHHGYVQDPMLSVGKRSRNRHLLLKALEEQPNSSWYQYYLAVEDYLVGNPESSLQLLRKLPSFEWIQGEPITLEVACLNAMGQWRNALNSTVRGTAEFPALLSLWIQQGLLGFAAAETGTCVAAIKVLKDPPQAAMGDRGFCMAIADFLEGCLAVSRDEAENSWRRSFSGYRPALRSLLRSIIRRRGLAQAVREIGDLSISPEEGFGVMLQGLIDLQNWQGALDLLERIPMERPMPGMGSVFWCLGKRNEALDVWREAGGGGWLNYGLVAALFGDPSDLKVAKEKVTPMQSQALTDLQQQEATWRLTSLVPPLLDIGSTELTKNVVNRAPFLNEAISWSNRLYIKP